MWYSDKHIPVEQFEPKLLAPKPRLEKLHTRPVNELSSQLDTGSTSAVNESKNKGIRKMMSHENLMISDYMR